MLALNVVRIQTQLKLQEFKLYFYDLILLDIKMPVINGFELCKKIRELDKTVQVIFITHTIVAKEAA
jgi:DNA-binding response OmpR family regulator